MKRALVVRGGWDGHLPVEATDLYIPFLRANGFDVEVSGSTSSYLGLDGVDLVLQCVTMGEITHEESVALERAVAEGMGLAGWHGGIVDSFRADTTYQVMTGGQFVAHPAGEVGHRIEIVSDDPIVAGISSFDLEAELYYVHYDPSIKVLATSALNGHADFPWINGTTMPAVWTRPWGEGRVFVATPGHTLDDLRIPEVRTIIERGLLWASR